MISSEGFLFWYSVNYLTNAAEMVIEDPKIGKLFG